MAKGLFSVHHGDLDEGLADYPDKSIDDVILTNTIQVLHRPLFLIREMARVGKRCIVSFPEFRPLAGALAALSPMAACPRPASCRTNGTRPPTST